MGIIFLTLIAASFHISAILNLIFLVVFINRISTRLILILFILSASFYYFYKLEQIEIHRLYLHYLGEGIYFGSAGAVIRYVINLVPAIIFILFCNKLAINILERNLYLLISIISILLVIYIDSRSTFIDRMILYLSSVQIIVFSRLPIIFKTNLNAFIIKIFVIVICKLNCITFSYNLS